MTQTTNDIQTVRDALKNLALLEPILKSDHHLAAKAAEALSRIEANTLPELPEGYTLDCLEPKKHNRNIFVCHIISHDLRDGEHGEGPTPRAAVLAAIAKVQS